MPWVVAGVGERVGLARQGFARPKGDYEPARRIARTDSSGLGPVCVPTATRNSFRPVCATSLPGGLTDPLLPLRS